MNEMKLEFQINQSGSVMWQNMGRVDTGSQQMCQTPGLKICHLGQKMNTQGILKYFFFINLFIYLFIFGCVGSSFLCEGFLQLRRAGPLLIAVRGPLTIAASLVAERRLSSCGSRAQLLRGMWDLPRPGLEPLSPALAGRLSTTAPPGKPRYLEILIRLATLGVQVEREESKIITEVALRQAS